MYDASPAVQMLPVPPCDTLPHSNAGFPQIGVFKPVAIEAIPTVPPDSFCAIMLYVIAPLIAANSTCDSATIFVYMSPVLGNVELCSVNVIDLPRSVFGNPVVATGDD